MNLQQEQKLTQKLSPRALQSINILQMNVQELREYVIDALNDNPVLDIKDSNSDVSNDSDYDQAFDWLVSNDYQNSSYYCQDNSDDAPDLSFCASDSYYTDSNSLSDYLWSQFICGAYSTKELEIIKSLIERLDSYGFLTDSPELLAKELQTSLEDICKYINILKNAEPTGVGSSNIQECLLIQAQSAPSKNQTAIEIIENHLDKLANKKFKSICASLKISDRELKSAVEYIKTLNPIPSSGFKNNETSQYITPDLFLNFNKNRFSLSMNDSLLPNIVVSSYYSKLLETTTDKEVKDYLSKKANQANWVISSIEHRHKTLYRCANLIVQKQIDYFYKGDEYLAPLTLVEIAAELNINESTVSRAINNKYIQSNRGVILLSNLLSTHVSSLSKKDVSVKSIKCILKQHLSHESKMKPLSDQNLSDILSKSGYVVSRRTVAKYREELGIPAAYARKVI